MPNNQAITSVVPGISVYGSIPQNPEEGDVYIDDISGTFNLYVNAQWIQIETIHEDKAAKREKTIDELLLNVDFDPEYFGFKPIPGIIKSSKIDRWEYKYSEMTFVIEQSGVTFYYIYRKSSTRGRDLEYYRGNLRTNKFALELFKNMDFNFLPIIKRENNLKELLD